MKLVENIHGSYVHRRRVRVLSDHIAPLLPHSAAVLDVGCGDGELAALIGRHREDVSLEGIDIAARKHAAVPVREFDGRRIPHADKSFDVVMFVDVLHHTDDPMILLREARRVARQLVVIKDHSLNGCFAKATLRFMDRVGNKRHSVPLPYNYWEPNQWQTALHELGFTATTWCDELNLYPTGTSWLFDRSLHFVAALRVPAA